MIFFRGIINFVDMMKFGYKTLIFSANTSGMDEEVENKSKTEKEENNEKKQNMAMTLSMLGSLAFAVGLFVAIPYFLVNLIGIEEKSHVISFNLLTRCNGFPLLLKS